MMYERWTIGKDPPTSDINMRDIVLGLTWMAGMSVSEVVGLLCVYWNDGWAVTPFVAGATIRIAETVRARMHRSHD